MTQDNFDLSHVGVYGIWMEDIDPKNRTLGPNANNIAKTIEDLVRRLNIPSVTDISTEYGANRQLCLYILGLAWSNDDLDTITKRLVTQNQHTKAAALAMFAGQRKVAYRVLRGRNATQSHKMLAMAIAGGSKKRLDQDSGVSGEDSEAQDDWVVTISSLADELTDPYARAILAHVKTGDWSNVVSEDSLPLKYRVCVAMRHLDDSKLTKYVSEVTKLTTERGDIEGIILTGSGTSDAFDLLSNYVSRFGDLQTAVLALSPVIPRYVDDEHIVRKFDAWKDAYRHMMNSWDRKFDRVRFDIACQRVSTRDGGRRLVAPPKQQVRLVCGFCTQSIAHSAGSDEDHDPKRKTVDTSQHPLTKEKAAALGTVCPKCGRHLPRCGVCNFWLGRPDESYLPWYGQKSRSGLSGGKGSIDLSASMTGSIQTIIGPDIGAVKGTDSPRLKQTAQAQAVSSSSESTNHGSGKTVSNTNVDGPIKISIDSADDADIVKEETEENAATKWDNAMSRFTVLCVKCSHGCHAAHARMWFEKHRICPVPECSCLCNG
jgi:hypothetical protein